MHSRAVKSHKARQRRGTFCLICGGPGGYFYAPAVLDSCPRPVQWLARPPRAPGAKLVQPLSFFCCVSKSAGCYPPRTTNVRCLSWEGASGLSVERAGGAAALETPPPQRSKCADSTGKPLRHRAGTLVPSPHPRKRGPPEFCVSALFQNSRLASSKAEPAVCAKFYRTLFHTSNGASISTLCDI